MVVRRVDLRDDMPTGRERAAVEIREEVHLRRCFFVLQHALSRHTRRHLCPQGVVCMGVARLRTDPEAAEVPPEPTSQRRDRDEEGGLDTEEL